MTDLDGPMEIKAEIKQIPRKSRSKRNRYYPYVLMALPGLLYLFVNNYLPMIGIVIAFKNIDYSVGILTSPWNGLENFKYLFSTSDALVITRNTILYNIGFIFLNTVIAIAIAIFLSEIKKKYMLKFYQSAILLPYLISMVIVAYLVLAVFSPSSGIMNKTILPILGLDSVEWYSEPKYWPFILPLVNIWKSIGFLCVIYLSSIIGIDGQYYEAARIDGANRWQQIRKITLPLIKPVVITMILLSIGRIFHSDFGLFFQVPMNSGMLYPTTNVIDTYVYRALMQIGDIGMASAAGLYQSVVGFVLVLTSNKITKMINEENALF